MKRRFLALGDSYTLGEGIPEQQSWPVQLVNALNASGIAFKPPTVIAQTGWTTDELAKAINASTLCKNFDLASLLIGVNNQYRSRPLKDFEKELAELLKIAIGFAGGDPRRVFVVSIPDWSVTPFANGRDRAKIAREIDEFNIVTKRQAEKQQVRFINVTGISRHAEANPDLLASDGLHPSADMYALWVQRMLPTITEKLRS
ncbi:SGNH/GDSL hydrolase family protein [candidate division KSB1 bacterium]|nr:SGNH/GDSL hydrolase family protein [candidate division KSB1 bacterium]